MGKKEQTMEEFWAEQGKFAGIHSKLSNAPEPKDVFTEEDVLRHISGKFKEKADNDVWFAATVQVLFRWLYEYNYWHLEKEGLDADDVEKVIFDVKRRINILVEKDGYELKPEDEEKAPPITSVEDFINMFGNK